MPSSADKFECRYCGCRQSKVVRTVNSEIRYQGRIHTRVVRYRRCRHCGLQYTTAEISISQPNHEIQTDAAVRPIYDYGRHVGALEVINGSTEPSQEQPIPKPPIPSDDPPKRRGASNPIGHLSPQKKGRRSK